MESLGMIEKNIIDFDDHNLDTDIKINPEYYIHIGLINCQKVLLDENAKSGLLKYYVLVEHIESLCVAAKLLDGGYEKEIKEFSEKEKKESKDSDNLTINVRIANYKLKLITKEVFSRKTITTPMKQ